MQLTLALSLPPSNHLTCGGVHSITVSHRFSHCNSAASFSPETLGIGQRHSCMHRPIVYSRPRSKRWGRWKRASFGEQGVDVVHGSAGGMEERISTVRAQ